MDGVKLQKTKIVAVPKIEARLLRIKPGKHISIEKLLSIDSKIAFLLAILLASQ